MLEQFILEYIIRLSKRHPAIIHKFLFQNFTKKQLFALGYIKKDGYASQKAYKDFENAFIKCNVFKYDIKQAILKTLLEYLESKKCLKLYGKKKRKITELEDIKREIELYGKRYRDIQKEDFALISPLISHLFPTEDIILAEET